MQQRKPTGKAAQASQTASTTTTIPNSAAEEELKTIANNLQKEINGLKETQKKMTDRVKSFDKKYNIVLDNIQGFKKNIQEQDTLMKEIMSFVQKSNLPVEQDLENIIHSYNNISNDGQVQLDRLSQNTMGQQQIQQMQQQQQQQQQLHSNTSMIPVIHASMRKRKRIQQQGWSVPPRVLLVDDDSIFRRLSTRLLQIAGCTIDVAVDGMEAVRKLGTGKYDLVLMVIL